MKKNPFTHISPWMQQVLHTIKKEIKTDHLSRDKQFYKRHFGVRPLNKLTLEEIFAVYERELLANDEELVDWVVNCWVFKHGDVYQYFADKLTAINPNFQEIEELSEAQAEEVLAGSESFGAETIYLFARINGVVFPEALLERMHQAALKDTEVKKAKQEEDASRETLEQMLAVARREVSRLHEKYEDKLAGVQRKYQIDVEALKKQVRALQKQLQPK